MEIQQSNLNNNSAVPPRFKAKNVPILVLLSCVMILSLVVYFSYRNSYKNQESQTTGTSAAQKANVAEITIINQGFRPSNITIKKGTTVVFKNSDSQLHGVASDPYPTKENLPSLDSLVSLPENGTFTYTFDQVGTWGYHDPLNPYKFSGEVIVTEK